MTRRRPLLNLTASIVLSLSALLPAAEPTPVTVEIKDYFAFPITGKLDGTGQTDGMLARINSLRDEPGGRNRFFVNDLNGPVYILDKATKKLTTYLDFNGRDGRPGIFHKLAFEVGFANGVVALQFDPDYTRNGRFYTIHIEDPALPGSSLPDNAHTPGLNVTGYEVTPAIRTPGPIQRDGVLIEWTDTKTSNATFEGAAREMLRVQLNTRIHPLGDVTFNPAARRGDSDWRVLYVACGDGGAGESSRPDTRSNPQRLDTLVGKILRIIPEPADRQSTSTLSDNGRYRIPNDNPFVSKPGARKEIWAYGLRNPHRLTWGSDPASRNECAPHRQLDWPAHVGNDQHHPQGRQLRVLAARGQRDAAVGQQDDEAARGRQGAASDQRHRERRGDDADLSRHSVSPSARAAVTPSEVDISTAARRFPRFVASTSSRISPPVVFGTPTTKRCSPRTMATPRRWRRCTS